MRHSPAPSLRGAKRRGNLDSYDVILSKAKDLFIATACVQSRNEATRQSPVFYPNREYEIATQKRLAMTDQNTMSGLHFMGVFPLFPLFPLFFDSAGWLFECKNLFC